MLVKFTELIDSDQDTGWVLVNDLTVQTGILLIKRYNNERYHDVQLMDKSTRILILVSKIY